VLGLFGLLEVILHFIMQLFFKVVRLVLKLFANNGDQVLVVSLHRLGDTVFTLPAINALHSFYGDRLTIICYPDSVPIYNLEFDNIDICEVEKHDFYFNNRIARFDIKRKIKKLEASIIFDITGSMISASLIFNFRAEKIVGTNGTQFKGIYDDFVDFRKEPKLADIYLDAISPVVEFGDRKKFLVKNISQNPEGKILIHPFAGWREKEWSLKKFVSIAEQLNQNYSASIIIQKKQISEDVINEIENLNIELIQTESVNHLIECIKDCSFFIGNDSGPVNVANYLGKPTLTIFGATNSDYTTSESEHQIYVQKSLKCSAGNNEKFCSIGGMIYSCSGVQCMHLLKVDELYMKLLPIVKEFCQNRN
jgi:heptosyltransferase II